MHNSAIKQRQARLSFAQANLNRNWDEVIFSDEKIFRIGHFTAGVWGWIGRGGPGAITFINWRLNSDRYVEILEDVLVPSVEISYESMANVILMQDNHPAHKSAYTRNWIANHPEITTLFLPSNSTDFNPIEDVWATMMIGLEDLYPHNRAQLVRVIVQRWESLRGQTQFFDNLYNSLPYRMQQVIVNNGGPAAY